MRNLNRLFVVLVLIVMLLVGSVAVAQGDAVDNPPDTGGSDTPVIVIDGGEDNSLVFIVITALGIAAGVIIRETLGQNAIALALQTGGLITGRTKTLNDDRWLIEVAMNLGYVPMKQPDGSITFEKKPDVPDQIVSEQQE